MRIQVNLATRPFVELRPFFIRLRLFMAVLAVAGVAIALGAHVMAAKAAKQQGELDRLRDQTIAAQQVRLRTEQRLRQPMNAAILDRAHFLNALFLKKSFSWTAVMMDLENVLPTGVQVTSIEPAVAADGSVLIRLRVGGERDRAVELVRNLERSRRFLYPRLGSEAAQSREGTGAGQSRAPGSSSTAPGAPTGPLGVEFEILATYNPLPAGEAYTVGHARTVKTAMSRGASGNAVSPLGATASPVSQRNLRNGYPADGVVLPAYPGPSGQPGAGRHGTNRSGASRPAFPQAMQPGGAR